MEKAKINIQGMSCNHCVQSVSSALADLPSVENIQVSLEENQASFDYNPQVLSLETVKEAIEDQGYDVV